MELGGPQQNAPPCGHRRPEKTREIASTNNASIQSITLENHHPKQAPWIIRGWGLLHRNDCRRGRPARRSRSRPKTSPTPHGSRRGRPDARSPAACSAASSTTRSRCTLGRCCGDVSDRCTATRFSFAGGRTQDREPVGRIGEANGLVAEHLRPEQHRSIDVSSTPSTTVPRRNTTRSSSTLEGEFRPVAGRRLRCGRSRCYGRAPAQS